MKQKKGFTLREVCGQKVVVAEGLEAINFGVADEFLFMSINNISNK